MVYTYLLFFCCLSFYLKIMATMNTLASSVPSTVTPTPNTLNSVTQTNGIYKRVVLPNGTYIIPCKNGNSQCGDEIVNGTATSFTDMVDFIAAGAFGKVYRCYKEGSSQPIYAIKECELIDKLAKKEATYLKTLTDKNVKHTVQYIDHGEVNGKLYIVQEYFPSVELFEPLTDGKFFDTACSDAFKNKLATELIEGMLEIHKIGGITHLDVKPENILIQYKEDDLLKTDMNAMNLQIKYIDFGFSSIDCKDTNDKRGTPAYRDDFYFDEDTKTGYNLGQQLDKFACPQSDYWALGLILLCIFAPEDKNIIKNTNYQDDQLENKSRIYRYLFGKEYTNKVQTEYPSETFFIYIKLGLLNDRYGYNKLLFSKLQSIGYNSNLLNKNSIGRYINSNNPGSFADKLTVFQKGYNMAFKPKGGGRTRRRRPSMTRRRKHRSLTRRRYRYRRRHHHHPYTKSI